MLKLAGGHGLRDDVHINLTHPADFPVIVSYLMGAATTGAA